MKPTLVVYYSRSGHTRRLAQEIAQACDADLEEIVDEHGRTGWFGYLRSALEALLGVEPGIRPSSRPPPRYALVIIGTPVWFWSLSSPVRSYVVSHRQGLRRVAFFCTLGGSGEDKVFRELQGLCGRPALAQLAITERELEADAYHSKLDRFVRSVLKQAGAAAGGSRSAAAGQEAA